MEYILSGAIPYEYTRHQSSRYKLRRSKLWFGKPWLGKPQSCQSTPYKPLPRVSVL